MQEFQTFCCNWTCLIDPYDFYFWPMWLSALYYHGCTNILYAAFKERPDVVFVHDKCIRLSCRSCMSGLDQRINCHVSCFGVKIFVDPALAPAGWTMTCHMHSAKLTGGKFSRFDKIRILIQIKVTGCKNNRRKFFWGWKKAQRHPNITLKLAG